MIICIGENHAHYLLLPSRLATTKWKNMYCRDKQYMSEYYQLF
jgi:hypothetical protein